MKKIVVSILVVVTVVTITLIGIIVFIFNSYYGKSKPNFNSEPIQSLSYDQDFQTLLSLKDSSLEVVDGIDQLLLTNNKEGLKEEVKVIRENSSIIFRLFDDRESAKKEFNRRYDDKRIAYERESENNSYYVTYVNRPRHSAELLYLPYPYFEATAKFHINNLTVSIFPDLENRKSTELNEEIIHVAMLLEQLQVNPYSDNVLNRRKEISKRAQGACRSAKSSPEMNNDLENYDLYLYDQNVSCLLLVPKSLSTIDISKSENLIDLGVEFYEVGIRSNIFDLLEKRTPLIYLIRDLDSFDGDRINCDNKNVRCIFHYTRNSEY